MYKVWNRNWPDHQQFSISFLESVQFSSSCLLQSVEGTLMPSLATIFIDTGSLPVKILPTLSKLNKYHRHWKCLLLLLCPKCWRTLMPSLATVFIDTGSLPESVQWKSSLLLFVQTKQIPPALKVSASSYCFEQSVFFAILRGGIIVSRVQLVPGGREGERADSFRNWWSMGGSVIVANNAKSFYQILPRPPSPLSSLFLLGDDRKCVQVQLLACP